MKFKFFLFLILALALSNKVAAQKDEGDDFFEKGKYLKALKMYNLYEKIEKRPETLIKRAICNYRTNRPDKCLTDLASAFNQGDRSDKLYLYTAKSYHVKQQFAKAAQFYKSYLKKVRKDPKKRQAAVLAIKQCGYAINARYRDDAGLVVNAGDIINSRFDELNAIQSPNDPNKFYFSANRSESTGGLRNMEGKEDTEYGSFKTDLYFSTKSGTKWNKVEALAPLLNSNKNELLYDISEQGSVLYYGSGLTVDNMNFMVDTFAKERKVELDRLVAPFVGKLKDKDLFCYKDSLFIFSSRRIGGYGGYDLYITAYKNGAWSPALNLGPTINGPYDEVSPFLCSNGKKLFFSSNNPNSFGGFDIFSSVFNVKSSTWEEVQNLALPVNSPSDDLYYRLTADGHTSTLSSNRIEGEGAFDIYVCALKNKEPFQSRYEAFRGLYQVYKKKLDEDNLVLEEDNSVEKIDLIKTDAQTGDEQISEEIVKTDLILEPLYYLEDDNVMTNDNVRKLNILADALISSKELKAVILSHGVREDISKFDIYFSFKRGEKIIKYLKEKGISDKQLILLAGGAQYPMLRERIQGSKNKDAEFYNRRIDLFIYDHERSPYTPSYKYPDIPSYKKDESLDLLINRIEGLSYRVVVANTKDMLKEEEVYNHTDVIIEDYRGKQVYTVGLFKRFADAQIKLNELTSTGLKKLYIVPYINAYAINANEASKLSFQYPDLEDYLEEY